MHFRLKIPSDFKKPDAGRLGRALTSHPQRLLTKAYVSTAQRRRISSLLLGRVARSVVARTSGYSVALAQLWPGRTDRLLISRMIFVPSTPRGPPRSTLAGLYLPGKLSSRMAARFLISIRHPRIGKLPCSGFGWLRHLRAADFSDHTRECPLAHQRMA